MWFEVEDQMDSLHAAIVSRLVKDLVVEPPELANSHSYLLVAAAHPRSLALQNKVVSVSAGVVLPAIAMEIHAMSGGKADDFCPRKLRVEPFGPDSNEFPGARNLSGGFGEARFVDIAAFSPANL